MSPNRREVAVLGSGAFIPGYAGLAGWIAGERSAEHEAPRAEIVPLRQRRRASRLSKALADAFAEALADSSLEPSAVASVFGAAIGEATTMVGLLDQMWGDAAMLSPMRFATSVHNAASGLISIATDNRGFTTAIGADFDTPAMALLEGIGLVLARNESVIVCCGDEPPPQDLVPEGAGWGLLSAAIVLGPVAQAPAGAPRLSDLAIPSDPPNGQAVDPRASRSMSGMSEADPETALALARNPNIGLLDLVVAIRDGWQGLLRLDRGAGRGFSIRIGAAA
ncbi:MAG TPA: hypothetical protein ENI85_01380 [Deltaproteobacteria bacterium]|nr:hypothetical protein [Deltaproteobacteria bacterium]